MKRLILFTLILILTGTTALFAQTNRCATDEVYQQMVAEDPTILDRQLLFDQQAATIAATMPKKAGEVRIIPVVFHIFHKSGMENILDSQIHNELKLLNQNFRRTGPKASQTRSIFQGVAADFEIEFRLARKDPFGNCTNGIVRIYEEGTNNGNDYTKGKSVWPTDRYLNVWVVQNISTPGGTTDLAGYAQFPWLGGYGTDGVIILSDQIGEIGTSNPTKGTTVTHEIGHWLGLLHTFQDSCNGGDKVEDTPPCANRTGILSCDFTRNTCGNDDPDLPDQIENYMDYTTGTCQNMFTIGQKARMEATMKNWRPNLWSKQNLILTGTDVPNVTALCSPVADFFSIDNQLSPNSFACANGTGVDFRDNSYNYTGTISRQWIFEGGNPATSTSDNPHVMYAAPGKYDVTLIVNNANGADTLVRKDFIEVLPEIAPRTAPYVQDFEFPVFPVDGWFTSSTSAVDYRISDVGNGTALEGNSRTLMVPNTNNITGSKFDLYSPSFDLSGMPGAKLSYFYAFAQRTVGIQTTNDRFLEYYSTDCGQSWNLLKSTSGSQLSTVNGPTSIGAIFVPADRTKWKQVTHDLPASLTAAERRNIRFRFQFISAGGNNFYIDAINIGFISSVEENIYTNDAHFSIYPNPTAGTATISLNLIKDSDIKVTVQDVMGREVAVLANGIHNEGIHDFEFNSQYAAADGVYFVKLIVDGQVVTKKLISTH